MVSEGCGARPPSRRTPSRGHVCRSPRCAAGLRPCLHVVQLGGGTGSAKSDRASGHGRTENDPGADSRSAEARTRLEANYAATSSLEELDQTYLLSPCLSPTCTEISRRPSWVKLRPRRASG